MPTAAVLGKGTLLKRGNGASPEVFTSIGELLDVPEAPASTRDLVDVTNHDSPGTDREFILGLGDGNEIQCRANFINNATQVALLTDKQNNTQRNFRIELPQYSPLITCSFTGIVREWTVETPVDAQITVAFTIKVSGTPSWDF